MTHPIPSFANLRPSLMLGSLLCGWLNDEALDTLKDINGAPSPAGRPHLVGHQPPQLIPSSLLIQWIAYARTDDDGGGGGGWMSKYLHAILIWRTVTMIYVPRFILTEQNRREGGSVDSFGYLLTLIRRDFLIDYFHISYNMCSFRWNCRHHHRCFMLPLCVDGGCRWVTCVVDEWWQQNRSQPSVWEREKNADTEWVYL